MKAAAARQIAAVILAAGQSRRMGQPKMVLPWGNTSVIGKVVTTILQAGVDELIVVTGGSRQLVEAALKGLPARAVFNPRYAEGEMLLSLQAGLADLSPVIAAVLVVLGDQPQIEVDVVRQIVTRYRESGALLIVPSYQRRRGHPWLVDRAAWSQILGLRPPVTLRDFLNSYQDQIDYLAVDTSSILQDLDTPEDYRHHRLQMEPNEAQD
jgi:molybdenum cofactor cytidylyltransferase